MVLLALTDVLYANAFRVALISPAIFFIGFFGWIFYNSKSAGLSDIPGPWLARYTDLWAVYRVYMTDPLGKEGPTKVEFYRSLQAKYGDFIRTGPRTVVVMDPNVVPEIYNIRARLEKVRTFSSC